MNGRIQKAILGVAVAAVAALIPVGLRSQSLSSMADTVALGASPGGCAALSAAAGAAQDGAAASKAPIGFNVANLDKSVSPCSDFFQFADGNWKKANPIPAEYSRWGTFDILRYRNDEILRGILEDAAANPKKNSEANWQKVGDYYASCMDEAAVDAAGVKPLQPEFERIGAIKDLPSLEAEVARLDHQGVDAVFGFGSDVDFKNSSMRIAEADQAGLSLPDRDYYLKDDAHSKKLRDQFVAHMTNMFKLLGDSPDKAASEASAILGIETKLAQSSMKREDLRNPDNVYHMMTLDQADALTPHFKWGQYLQGVGSPKVTSLNIGQPDFFKGMDAALGSVSLDDWKTYLRWHLLHNDAPALPKTFVDENFDFFIKTLTGAQAQQPRWRRCVRSTDTELGEALGQYYVKQAFPPEAKAKAMVMVKNLMSALHDDLQTLDWMSPATRQQATGKLDAFLLKIGYPDKWRDYSAYAVTRQAYVVNFDRGNAFNNEYDLARIGRPVERTEWEMTPPTVNAYYDPTFNEIVFPAGILQPPFFDPKADDAINYGAIGMVIGHEMTHGFDDQGARFDAKGNLANWWTSEDYKNFQARGDCIVKEFSGFQVEDGLNENGKLVEGEAIADLGGLTIAYRAFHKSLEGKPEPAPIDGFTADQRFFLAFGQVWATNLRIEQARVYVATDPHPLAEFRVNGTLQNMPTFEKAFGCGDKSAMNQPEGARCRIW
jgi:putative endopeptidase